ncbi:FimV/HubP family polar landmark protein [Motiliproteus sp.]|uniref:FimV/HubP family polar landmark protein n=1 Tax=Motiliproteus sp. TaxID=1898955 RepID=UPI003BA95C27
MLRKCAISLAVIGALSATQANALGLGEVKVSSALNQPLKAEIDLLQLRGLNASQIITGLADADDFFLAGVKPTAVLSDLNFKLDIKGGQGRIILTTNEPIREPFLNFLIEVNWPSGRLVREYTVLLDPPVFTAGDLAPRNQPVAPVSQPKPMAKAVKQGQTVKPASSAPAATMTAGPGTYYVKNDDTLWQIALRTRPDKSISPQQMMMAIQRANPDAFYNNNINRLKSGVVLEIPGKQEILGVGHSESMKEVKRQNSTWKGEPATAAKPEAEKLDAAKQEMAPAGKTSEQDAQLRIVSKPVEETAEPKETMAEPMATASSETETAPELSPDQDLAEELAAKNEELEEQLVVTLEGLEKVERDNTEMFDRLDQLSQQMESLQRLVELKDQQLAELQGQLAQKQAEQAPVAPTPAPSAGSDLPLPLSWIAGIGAGVLALLGGLLVFMRKRREDQEVEEALVVLNEQEAMQQQLSEEQPAEAVEDAVAEAAAVATMDEVALDDNELDQLDTTEDPDDPFNMAAGDGLADELDTVSTEELDNVLGDDLDLDMDLKLDEPIEEDPEMAAFSNSLLDDDEYDLSTGIDEDEPSMAEQPAAEQELDMGDDIDTDLDALLGEGDDGIDFGELDMGQESGGADDELAAMAEPEDFEVELPESSDEEALAPLESSSELDALLGEDDTDLPAFDSDDLDEFEVKPVNDQVDLVGDEDDDEIPDDDTLDALLGQADAGDDSDEPGAAKLAPESTQLDEALEFDSIDDLDDVELGGTPMEADPDEVQLESLQVDDLPDQQMGIEEQVGSDEAEFVLDDEPSDDTTLDLADVDPDGDALAFDLEDETDDALSLDVDEPAKVPADLGEPQAEVSVSTLTLEDDLDEAGEDELEAELEQMLESEDNAVSLEETELDAESTEINYLDEADEVGTKLDLARAYIDMDDVDGARDILQEVIGEGSPEQAAEAQKLLENLST